jgi:tetratricopeptide (TPR) repeat protein
VARLDELRARWEKEPSSRAFVPLAEEYRRLGRLGEAERTCKEGLQRHSNYHSAHVLLGRILLDLDRRDEAAEEFRRVLESEPQNLLAGKLLAGIRRDQGRWGEALEIYRGLQLFYPENAEVRTQVYQLERGPEGGEATTEGPAFAASVPPAGDALATNTLAEIYLRQGLVDRAVAVYENMLRADPDNQAVRHRISEIQGATPIPPVPSFPAPVVSAPIPSPSVAGDPRQRVIQGLQTWLIAIQKG